MARGPATFRQRDVAAAIRAAKAAGCEVVRVEVDKAGKIIVVTAGKPEPPPPSDKRNEWDQST
ncbi:MAG: hypothetical protein WA459_24790 [Stellaceae bacterium]